MSSLSVPSLKLSSLSSIPLCDETQSARLPERKAVPQPPKRGRLTARPSWNRSVKFQRAVRKAVRQTVSVGQHGQQQNPERQQEEREGDQKQQQNNDEDEQQQQQQQQQLLQLQQLQQLQQQQQKAEVQQRENHFAFHCGSGVRALTASACGKIACGCDGGSLHIFDPRSKRCLATLAGHTDAVSSVCAFGDLLVSASHDSSLRVHSISKLLLLHVLRGHRAAVLSVAMLHLAKGAAKRTAVAVSASRDLTLRTWDCACGAALRVLSGHERPVTGLWVCGGLVLSASNDATARVWDAVGCRGCLQTLRGHSAQVFCVELTPEGIAVTGSQDGTVRVWQTKGAVAAAGAASGMAAPAPAGTVDSHPRLVLRHPSPVHCLRVFSACRRLVTGGQDAVLRVFELEHGTVVRELRGHSSWVMGVVPLSERKFLSCSCDKTVRLWNVDEVRGEVVMRHGAAVFTVMVAGAFSGRAPPIHLGARHSKTRRRGRTIERRRSAPLPPMFFSSGADGIVLGKLL